MTDVIELKPAAVTDVPQILAFIKELAEFEKLLHDVVATEEGLKEVLFGARPRAEVVMAFLNNAAVGFALYFHNYSTFAGRSGLYLEDLYVQPAARGKRIGQKLFAHLAQIANERNCARMEWSVLDWNTTAIEFYQNFGAKPLDEWTTFRLSGDALQKLGAKIQSETA
jgi:GNAT superfamily N-acetyltransferase